MSSDVLIVTAWDSRYETAHSRNFRRLTWVTLGLGLRETFLREIGQPDDTPSYLAMMFGCWLGLLEIAANEDVRGTIHNNPDRIAGVTGFPSAVIEPLILRAMNAGWLQPEPSAPDAVPSPSWDDVAKRLRACGVLANTKAAKTAQSSGWSVEHALSVIRHFETCPRAWDGFCLATRFQLPAYVKPCEGWPKPSREWSDTKPSTTLVLEFDGVMSDVTRHDCESIACGDFDRLSNHKGIVRNLMLAGF